MKICKLPLTLGLLAITVSACGMERASLSALDLQQAALEDDAQRPVAFEKSYKAYSSQDDLSFFLKDSLNLYGIPNQTRFNSYRPGYEQLWQTIQLRPEHIGNLDWYVNSIVKNKDRYESIEAKTGVPWFFVGIVHGLEAGFDFSTHLHNGDSLSKRTWQVPAGRPTVGNPPFSWEYSAVDAMAYDGFLSWTSWNDPAVLAYAFESYNGFGYRQYGINSPYLYSFSKHYSRGKYVADGRYDGNAVSQQGGAMSILKRGLDRGMFALNKASPSVAEVSADAQPALARDLHEGLDGNDVKLLQMRLADYGYFTGAISGAFDVSTESAVVKFQAAAQLTADGVVGKMSWQKLWPSLANVSWLKGFKIDDNIRLYGMQGGQCLFRVESKDVRMLSLFMKSAGSAETVRYGGAGTAENLPNPCPDFRNVYNTTSGKIVQASKTLVSSTSGNSGVTWHKLSRGNQDFWRLSSFAGGDAMTSLDSGLKSEIVKYFEAHSKAIDVLSDAN